MEKRKLISWILIILGALLFLSEVLFTFSKDYDFPFRTLFASTFGLPVILIGLFLFFRSYVGSALIFIGAAFVLFIGFHNPPISPFNILTVLGIIVGLIEIGFKRYNSKKSNKKR